MRRNKNHGKSARQTRHAKRLDWRSWLSSWRSLDRALSLRYEQLEDRRLMSVVPPVPLTPQQIIKAFGLDQVQFNNIRGDGTGQIIAILDPGDDPKFVDSTDPGFATSDLHKFDLEYHLPDPPSFTVVGQNGRTGSRPSGIPATNTGETAGDIEWAHVVAPGASIVLIEMNSFAFNDIAQAITVGVPAVGASIVSMSFNFLEQQGETGANFLNDNIFKQPGVTFVNSSGDNGSVAQYLATSPNVLGVSATNIYLNGDNTYNYEDGWSDRAGIESLKETGHTVTVTMPDTNFTFNNGDQVRIVGASIPQYDGTYAIHDVTTATLGTPGVTGTISFQYDTPDFIDLGPAHGGAAMVYYRFIDDGDPFNMGVGFQTTGTWNTVNSGNGYHGDYQTASAGANTASYTFGVANNKNIGVSLSWAADPLNATNTLVQVYDGTSAGTLLYSQNINQKNAPLKNIGSTFSEAIPFQQLAQWVQATTGILTVVISGVGADGKVVADDVQLSLETNAGGTGGGISQYESQPGFQTGKVNNDNTNDGTGRNTTQRLSPDVSWLGGVLTPVAIYDSNNTPADTNFFGSSLAAPMWAGLVAIINQGRVMNGQGTLSSSDQTNGHGIQTLLYNLPSADFNDITSGYNGYKAGPGYDLVTGLGTPKVPQLVNDIVGPVSTGIGVHHSQNQYSDATPAIASVNGNIYIAWRGRENHDVNLMQVNSTTLAPIPESHFVSGNETDAGPALVTFTNVIGQQQLWVAWTNDDDDLYIAQVDINSPNPLNFVSAPVSLGQESDYAPSLAVYNGKMYVAWTDDDDAVNIMRLNDDGTPDTDTRAISAVTAKGSTALGVVNGQLMVAFAGNAGDGEDHLFAGQVKLYKDGGGDDRIAIIKVSNLHPEVSNAPPALGGYVGIGWTGQDDHLNAMLLAPEYGVPDAYSTTGGAGGIQPHPINFGETADDGVSLTGNYGSPLIVWNGTDGPGTIYVARIGRTNGQSVVGEALVVNAVDGDNNVSIKNLGGGTMEVTLNGETVDYPPGTIHKIVVNTGDGNNVVDVFSTVEEVPVEIDAGSGNTTVNVARDNQNLTQLAGDLTVNGNAGGNTQLVLFDNLDNSAENYTLTKDSFQSTHSGKVSYQDLKGLAIQGGIGNNVLTVDSSTGLVTIPEGVHFDGGGGSNSVSLIQTDGDTQTTDTYRVGPTPGQGSNVIVGPSGMQTIYFQNLAPFFDNVPVTTQNVFATPAANAINYTAGSSASTGYITIDEQESYEFTNKVHLIINALAGSDEINLNNPNTPTGLVDITVNGNDPTASDTLIVNGTPGNDTVNYAPTGIDSATITGAGPVTIFAATMEHVTYSGQGGADALTYTTPMIGGSDQYHLLYTPGATGDAGTILGNNLVSGQTLLPFDFQNIGNGTLNIKTADNTRSDFLELFGTAASDQFVVNATGGGTVQVGDVSTIVNRTPQIIGTGLSLLEMHGLAGRDNFLISAATGMPFALIVDGGDGTENDTVVVSTPNTAITTSFQDAGFTQTLATGLNLTTQRVGSVQLNAPTTAGVATWEVKNTGTGLTDTFAFTPTALGAGSLQVTSTGATAPTYPVFGYSAFTGNLTVTGGSASQKDSIGLTATTGNDIIDVNQIDATHFTYRQNSFLQGFAFANVLNAAIAALSGDDLVRVSVADALETTTPNAALRYDVDGGGPNGIDRLLVNDDGLGDLILWRQSDDNQSGSVTVGAFAPVTYVGIERVDITPVDPLFGYTGTDLAGRIKIFHTDPYEYNDKLLNAASLQRIGANATSPNIDPAGIPGFNLPGDNDFYVFRPQGTGTFQVGILFKTLATLANGRPGLPGNGDLALDIYDANGVLITSGIANSDGSGKTATFAATNDPNFAQFNTIYVRVHGASAPSVNDYEFNNIAALITGLPGVSAADLEGPQVTDVRISDPTVPPVGTVGENLNYNLFGIKPGNAPQGPTPLVNAITINFKDLPARFPGFLYPALDYMLTADQARGLFQVIGDATGIAAIKQVVIHNDPVTLGGVPTGEIQIIFQQALPDDRFTFTISDSLRDPAQNKLDGESNASEPNAGPNFPSGDGHSGGNFVARFTIDTRPELGNFAAARVFIDINGNSIYDPTNLDFTNRDMNFTMQLDPVLVGRAQLGVHDSVFAGNFFTGRGSADGFDKLGLYGTDPVAGVGFRWLLDTDDNGTADLLSLQGTGFNVIDQNGAAVKFTGIGIVFAGNFDGNAANGDEIGLFDGTHYFLDTNHNFVIDSGDTAVTTALRGFPIVGDFNGDGTVDLGTWQTDVFQFNFGTPGTGGNTGIPVQFTGNKDSIINFGFPGVGEVPLAEDMDHDGITDVGLWVPGRSGSTTADIAETYFLISHDFGANGLPLNTGLTDPTAAFNLLNHAFAPTPLGNDIYSNFLDEFATPVVGNFDPPAAPATATAATDTLAPTSSVNALAATQTSRVFNVSWSGTDGSGIASYDVYVSDNGGSYTLWQDGVTTTSATFTGINSHSYKFFSVATDNAGNVQDTPAGAQATTSIQIRATTTTVLAVSSGSTLPGQNVTFTATVGAVDVSNPTPIGTVTFKEGSTVLSTVTLVNGVATFNKANFAAGNHNITATYNPIAPYVTSASATVVEHIVNAVLAADPGNAALTALFIAGTTGNDIITLAVASGGGVAVSLNTNGKTTSLGTFKPTGHIFVSGLAGTDTLVAPNVANTWVITGANAGTLNGNSFDGIENLTGGSAADVFRISAGGSLSGKISGGAGANTLDYSAYAAASSLNLQTGAATGTAGATGITNFIGSGSSTLVGPNKAVTWNITGANAGNVNGVAFSGTSNLTGGTANDTFAFANGAGVNGIINGGAGTDSLKYSAYTTPVTVNLSSQAATGAAGITAIEGMVGGSASDTLVGPNQNNAWNITSANTGKVNSFTFTSTENLTGGSANDNFVFNKSVGVAGHVEGSAGINMLDYAAYTTAVNVNLAAGTATNIGGGVSNIRVVLGGSAADNLTGDDGDDALIGGAGNDILTAGSGRNLLFGGLGADTLNGGAGESILFSGTTTFDTNLTSIDNLLTYWARNDLDYATRVAALKAGTAAGAPKLSATTVKNDTSVNTLNGGSGLDWFFAKLGSPKDTINNQITGEQVN